MSKIILIDSGVSNLKSIKNMLDYLHADYDIVSQEFEFDKQTKIILPGIGNYGSFVKNLKLRGLIKSIIGAINNNIHFLGICIGLHFLCKCSEEDSSVEGLNILENVFVKKFYFEKKNMKIPLIDKKKIIKSEISWKNTILNGIPIENSFYFLHSYYCKVENKYELAKTFYEDIEFSSVIKKNNIYGVQFHPEKSRDLGLLVLKNFINI